MARKKIEKTKNNSIKQYFDDTDTYCPFKGLKIKTKKSEKKTIPTTKAYEMYPPKISNVIQKAEELPLSYLLDCEPQESLDLHGKMPSRDDIVQIVKDFLSECVSKDLKKVEVIVGRGKHSIVEPIMPQIVEAVLKNSTVVRTFDYAPNNKGSFWIILGAKQPKNVNLYSSKDDCDTLMKGLESVKVKKTAKKIDYESYLPNAYDILDKN